jgi:hypothetical protein
MPPGAMPSQRPKDGFGAEKAPFPDKITEEKY